MSLSSIINKTDFIKKCSIASFIFTGSAAIIACISCYITFENYKLIKENRKLIKENSKLLKIIILKDKITNNQFIENDEPNVNIVEPKSPEFIVIQTKNALCEDLRENQDNQEMVKNEKDYLDMFEDYHDIPNKNEKDFSLYKFFKWF
jgi:hypothetical protein